MLRPLATCVAFAGFTLTQEPPAWADLPVPNGVANATVSSIGKVVAVVEGSVLHCWSAASRRWFTHTYPTGSVLRLCNDLVLVTEPAAVTVFSAYASAFATVAVSPQAQLVNPGGQNNDSLVLVQDGATLHAFSCFTGSWTSRSFATPVAAAVQRHVGIAMDGTLVAAIDAYTATWHDLTVAVAPQALSCDGMAGFAIGPQEVHAFSALHGTWSSQPLTGQSTLVRDDDWGVFWEAGSALAYSAITGTFASLSAGPITAPTRSSLCAVAATAAGYVAFSAPRGTWSQVLAPLSARMTTDGSTVLFADGPQLTGYSAVRGTATTIAFASVLEQTAGVVGLAFESTTGLPVCFSAMTGNFHLPPNDVLPMPPALTTTSALLPSAGGGYAFAARTGGFVPVPSSGPGMILLGTPQSAVAAAYDGSTFFAFDAHRNVFVTVPRQSAQPPAVAIWRTTMTMVDGGAVHGFSTQTGRFASTILPGPYAGGRANSESGRIDTPDHVLAYSGSPSLAVSAQFPGFRRVQPIGAPLHLSIALAGGGVAAIAGGAFAPSPVAIPGLGEFRLTAPLATLFVSCQPGTEFARVQLPIPAVPGLIGVELGFQALALPVTGSPYLGDAAGLYLL